MLKVMDNNYDEKHKLEEMYAQLSKLKHSINI